ncbi:ribonuclease M5 [Longirhabdus pacifica]|uniref:ribonuclease M5 n=1 Tax=Longirhabdus pacifica TaxID=2305227 RepID=UPI001008ED85|nr:ribonuclease M5 [Longirhabdus pacifica]
MIQEVIVVEGKDDTTAIKRAVDADTIETGGSAINKQIIASIRLAQKRRGVIIFTDPDFAGEKIRKTIASQVSGCKHAFITQDEAKRKKNIGVENASPATIKKALEEVKSESTAWNPQVTMQDLIVSQLVSHPHAASRRLEMGNLLRIGCCNGKQFLKRLSVFQITKEEFERALQQLDGQRGESS